MADDYVICEFPEENNAIEVVCLKWLNEDQTKCKFPPVKRYQMCLKKKFYDATWNFHNCKVLSKRFREAKSS